MREIEIPGAILIKTITSAEGASVVKLGTIDSETLCAIPIREDVEVSAIADIGGVTSSQPIVISGAFGRLSKFTCSAQELIIVTPAPSVGDVVSKFLRIQ